jgi:hypothetical protein
MHPSFLDAACGDTTNAFWGFAELLKRLSAGAS